MRRLSFCVLFLSLLSISPLTAASSPFIASIPTASDLIIEGDQVIYEKDYSSIHATGNVQLSHQGATLNTSVFHYSLAQKKISIPHRFILSRFPQQFIATNFNYNTTTKKGTAQDLEAYLLPWYIKGKQVYVSSSNITITNAYFTTCDSDNPKETHYKIQSKKIMIYPALGMLVAYDNQISLPILPFNVPFPTYIYGNTSSSLLGFNTPIPVFGGSNREGSYIKQKIPYLITPYSTGDIEIGTLSRLGLTFGLTHRIRDSLHHSTTFMGQWHGHDGLGGGLIFEWAIPKLETKNKKDSATTDWMNTLLTSFAAPQDLSFSRGLLHITYGQLIDDSRLDRTPELELYFTPWMLGDSEYGVTHYASLGYWIEHPFGLSDRKAAQTSLHTELGRTYPAFLGISPSLFFMHQGQWYDFSSTWQRVHLRTGISADTLFHPRVTYVKNLYHSGTSPFIFEKRYAVEFDEIEYGLSQHFGDIETGFLGRYSLEYNTWITSELLLAYKIHCWKLVVKWGFISELYSFGIELF